MEKRNEIGSVFVECKLDILGLSEKKLRGEGELSFGGVKGFKSRVGRRSIAREGVAVMMNQSVLMRVREIRRILINILINNMNYLQEEGVLDCDS